MNISPNKISLLYVRAKSIAEKADPSLSKYIDLAKNQDSQTIFGENKFRQAVGEMRGTAKLIESIPGGIIIHTDTNECLELKVLLLHVYFHLS